MVGAVLHRARDLRVERCIMPELKAGHVLVRVRRAGICGSTISPMANARLMCQAGRSFWDTNWLVK
jgi:threonine dehydrogenase-like Zn-dependent dehydrogenase